MNIEKNPPSPGKWALKEMVASLEADVKANALITITMRQAIIADTGLVFLSDDQAAQNGSFICDKIDRSIRRAVGSKSTYRIFVHGRDGHGRKRVGDSDKRKHLHIPIAVPPALSIRALQRIVIAETRGKEWIYEAGAQGRNIDHEVKSIADSVEDRLSVFSYCLKGDIDNLVL